MEVRLRYLKKYAIETALFLQKNKRWFQEIPSNTGIHFPIFAQLVKMRRNKGSDRDTTSVKSRKELEHG